MLRLDLICANGLGLVQDSDYGPITFRLRNRVRDRYVLTVSSSGSDGDTVSAVIFGADSDKPELNATVTYTVQAGDGVDEVAAGLVGEIMSASVEAVNEHSGKLETVYLRDHVQARDTGSGTLEISGVELGVWTDISASATGGASMNVSSIPETARVSLSDSTITAVLRLNEESDTVIDTWDSDQFTILSPATAGRFSLEVSAGTSQGYDFDRAWYQLEVYNSSTGARKRWFEGAVELDRSMMIGLGGGGGGTLPP